MTFVHLVWLSFLSPLVSNGINEVLCLSQATESFTIPDFVFQNAKQLIVVFETVAKPRVTGVETQ